MKTHFTQADVGKTFATSKGQNVILISVDGKDKRYSCLFKFTDNPDYTVRATPTGRMGYKGCRIYPHSTIIPSEADLLRKEIEELKSLHMADLINAIEMAIELSRVPDLVQDKELYMYTPDEIIEKILKK